MKSKNTQNKLEVKYGLPSEVLFCKICNITNQRPDSTNEFKHTLESKKTTINFNKNGICRACEHKEEQHEFIDWDVRDKELKDLCDRFRKKDGSYDCIVPGSGGKDSAYQAHILKTKYGMNPLTCTWPPILYTDYGYKNFINWLDIGGFDKR